MKAKVQNWGNSLGLRIPKVYSEETGIVNGSTVNVILHKGNIIIEPLEKEKSLKELLSCVTKNNLHNEIATDAMGEEVW
jgi:antitoxin MazE